jgi:GntR family transcriptional regulator
MSFNKNLPVQLHYQLTNALRENIQSGEWNIGDLFLTDREIMEKYNVSATTVRRAIMQLVSEGWLERKRGKGTFILKEPLKEDLMQLTGFFEEMYNQGLQPSADIHFQDLIEVTDTLVKQFPLLGVFKSKQLVLLEKVHKVNGKPLFYVQSFWWPEYGQTLLKWNITNRGTYDIAAKELGLYLSKADETIRAGLASHAKRIFYM